jgi:predicted nucleic acid-binding protein
VRNLRHQGESRNTSEIAPSREPTNLLVDTSVLIDVLRAQKQRRKYLAQAVREGHTLVTTALNVAELYAGMWEPEVRSTEALLAGLECIDVSGTIARLAGKLKRDWAQKGRTLTLADTIVAATAIERNCPLLTNNRRDFPMPKINLLSIP